jgi:phenylpyruvate tautomerase PptA (4-oxalocrotonate tautomerase family)
MSVVEIQFVDGQHLPSRIEELLRRVSQRVSAVLGSPVGRVRVFVTMHPPELWATGGVPAAQDGDPAAYFVAVVLQESSPAQRGKLLTEITDALCDALGVTRDRVHGRVAQVPPEDCVVGGVLTSSTRGPEVVVRSTLV